MRNKTISVLGCGWLGLPLAKALIKKGWTVKGSTTNHHKLQILNTNGIDPFLLDISNASSIDENKAFFNSPYLIINIPPSKNQGTLHLYKHTLAALEKSKVEKIIFISSTSAYTNHDGLTFESDAIPKGDSLNKTLIYEHQFLNLKQIKTSIVRFAGLIGGSRHPGNFFKNGRTITQANAPTNLIHLDDCIGIIQHMLDKECWNEIINACADEHPTKKEFYTKAAAALHKTAPVFNEHTENKAQKIISNQKSKELLGYTYRHPNPLAVLDSPEF